MNGSQKANPYIHDALLGPRISTRAITRGRNGTYEEGINEGIGKYNELIPIQGGEGVQSQPSYATGNCSKLNVIWGNPSDPVEVRHRLEDVVREPEVDEHGSEAVHEPPHPGDCPAVDRVVGPDMEGTVEGNSCQVDGPDSLGRIDEESTG